MADPPRFAPTVAEPLEQPERRRERAAVHVLYGDLCAVRGAGADARTSIRRAGGSSAGAYCRGSPLSRRQAARTACLDTTPSAPFGTHLLRPHRRPDKRPIGACATSRNLEVWPTIQTRRSADSFRPAGSFGQHGRSTRRSTGGAEAGSGFVLRDLIATGLPTSPRPDAAAASNAG